MSIRDFITSCLARNDLIHVRPALPFIPQLRSVYASQTVAAKLLGPWPDDKIGIRLGRARAAVDAFISGNRIAVRMPPSRDISALIALLDKAEEEVWEIRARDPKPGVRIFGRFSEKNVFIALDIAFKEDIENFADYSPWISACKREWAKCFATYPPHTGSSADDYISNIFTV